MAMTPLRAGFFSAATAAYTHFANKGLLCARYCTSSMPSQRAAMASGRSIMSRYFNAPSRPVRDDQAEAATKTHKVSVKEHHDVKSASQTGTLDTIAQTSSSAMQSKETLFSVLAGLSAHVHNFCVHIINAFADLEAGREVRAEALRLVERSPEYASYEKDVDFEMSIVRRRYVMGGPLTPARRAQMQAHLGQIQEAIMVEHAHAAADAFTDSLSASEAAQLREWFTKLDNKGVPVVATSQRTPDLSTLLDTLTDKARLQARPREGSDAAEQQKESSTITAHSMKQ